MITCDISISKINKKLHSGGLPASRYISAADVKRFFNNQMLSNLVTADKLCAKVGDLAGKANIKDVELINKFHRGCVSLTMNKKHPEVTGLCETLEELAHVFVKEVHETHHVLLNCSNCSLLKLQQLFLARAHVQRREMCY